LNIVVKEVGIDVHKQTLLVSIDGAKAFSVANAEEPIKALAGRLCEPCRIHVEASGGYERLVARIFGQAGIEVCVHNALKAHRLSQALRSRAKTDPVDARSLASNGPLLVTHPRKSDERRALADLSRALDSVKDAIADFKKRRDMPEVDQAAKECYSEAIKRLTTHLKDARKQFLERVRSSTLDSDFQLAISVPDIGPQTARICICELPEDWKTTPVPKLCAYAALAPIDDSSGKRVGVAHVGQGNKRLKGAFYMPALSAIKRQVWAKDLYARLRAKGRGHLQAIVAVMRRLFIRVLAVMRRGSPWRDEPIALHDAQETLVAT
jgi:transposase